MLAARITVGSLCLAPLIHAGADTQAIPLRLGWNLVSLQVASATNGFAIAQIQAGLDRTNALESIWAYDAGRRSFAGFFANSGSLSELTHIQPGVGYWMKVNSDAVLTVNGEPWNGAVQLAPGWNLVGFPGNGSDSEGTPVQSVLRDQIESVSQVWTFEPGSSLTGGQRYVGYDRSARPPLLELERIGPGRGYWVFSGASVRLEAAPALVLAPDTDNADAVGRLAPEVPFVRTDPRWKGANATPFEGRLVRFAGPEDGAGDLNRNGVLDDPYTQDTMRFEEGVNTQNITILNTNASVLSWTIASTTPWLAFSSQSGTTSSEADYVEVTVNRNGLTSGTYVGGYTVEFGSSRRQVAVQLQVPPVAGDYRGAATTVRINGKPISLGKVDLNLSVFMEGDAATTNRFRGVINRDSSLLFPQDVFLDGVFYQGNSFSLTTSFEMAAGQQFDPPYGTATNLFNYNPFPRSLYRQITLLGTRTTADRIEGSYVESITGMLPGDQRVQIEGTFQLDRQSLAPTRRSIYNGRSGDLAAAIGGAGAGASSYTNRLTVNEAVSIQGLQVNVRTAFPAPEQLTLTLVAPDGRAVLLQDRAPGLAASASFRLSQFNGALGRGEWQLIINWNGSPERGLFQGWELNLEGLATYAATGKVVGADGTPVAGATLTLAGGNIIFQAVTPADGTFAFPTLTENAYTLAVSKLGHLEASRGFRIQRANTNLGNLTLPPVTVATGSLLATPTVGAAPLFVRFSPVVPLSQLSALGGNVTSTWTFGDGTLLVLTNPAATVTHTYAQGLATNATVVLRGATGTPITLTSSPILAHALGPNTNIAWHQRTNVFPVPRRHFLFAGAFVGTLASPVQNPATVLQPVISTNPTTGYLYQESKRDVAAFDIDRFRAGTAVFDPTAEDTGFFVQTETPYARGSLRLPGVDRATPPASGQAFVPYPPPGLSGPPTRFRLISTLGGGVFGAAPASSGNFVLQVGRTEP